MNRETFLITPRRLLSGWLLASDRERFSRPVRVELMYTEISTRLLFVREVERGIVYPTNPKWVREAWTMSRRELREAA
jgi:hypothetical protein